MSKVINSIRIFADRWENEETFDELLKFLSQYGDCIDQVALFSTHFHPPMPLETAARHCETLKDRIKRVKAAGFSCGLNILATVGHHPERLDESLQGDWTYMTNIDGEICLGSRCMNNPAYLEEYVGPLYKLHCDTHPDFIWIDDDIRYGHIPVGFCCFCDNCIARFNRDFKYSYDRSTLKADLNICSNVYLRKQWLTHQSDKIADLLSFIRKTVDDCDNRIMLGLMTGERYFEGYDFNRWAYALSGGGKHEIMWRPGGGNYDDRSFDEFIWKSSEIGRQTANLPLYVTEVQSEIENHPYRLLRKGPRYTALEALMDLSVGCTGTAFNIMPGSAAGESADVISGHLAAIRNVTPFMHRLSSACKRNPAVGIHCGWHIHSQATVTGEFTKEYGGEALRKWQEMYSLGLPEGFGFSESSCYLLSGRTPYAFEKEELELMLSRGIYLDAEAVQSLEEMGYGDLIGFSVGGILPEDISEVYSDHTLNSGFIGKRRYCSPIFSNGESRVLIPKDGAEVLCFSEDFRKLQPRKCTMGIYRNRLGGIICAAGYYPCSELSDSSKTKQLKRIFRLLSDDKLAAVVDSYERIRVSVRRGAEETAVTLLNTTPDRLTDVQVLLAGCPNEVTLCSEDCEETVLTAACEDGAMTRYIVPEIPAYSMVLIIFETRN